MEIKLNILFIVVSLCTVAHSESNYCNWSDCDHTMCKYPQSGQAATCEQALGSGLKDEEKKEILKAHNEFRKQVASGKETRGSPGPQPPASSMPDLTWDDDLATVAQRWADQCNFGHDTCRRTAKYDYAGQNVAYSGTTGDVSSVTMASLVKMWTDEVQYFNPAQISSFDGNGVGGEVGHYTQVVWAATKAIGCGLSKYNKDGYNNVYLVCNYGPGGNYVGQPIYNKA